MDTHPDKRNNGLSTTVCFWLLGLAFFSYTLIRVFSVDLVNDEATGGRPIAGLITFKWVDAQIHFLTDVIITLCIRFFPVDVVTAMRIPCLLAFGVYLYAVASIASFVKPRWLSCLAFAAFASNAFMLDFFSLGRGYGVSLGLSMLSLKFLFDRHRGRDEAMQRRGTVLSIWSASLAVFSNLAYLHFYMALATVLVVLSIEWGKLKEINRLKETFPFLVRVLKDNAYILTNGMILGIFYLPRVMKLVEAEKLYAGGTRGFIADTITSLVSESFYDVSISDATARGIAYALVVITVLISVRLIVSRVRRTPGENNGALSIGIVFSSLLVLLGLISVLLHLLADVRFLMSRTALIFIPLFIGQITFFGSVEKSIYLRVPAWAIVTAMIGLFACNANLTHTDTWVMNSRTRQLFRDMRDVHEELGRDVVLGVSDAHKPKLGDYMRIMDIQWLKWYSIDMYHRFNGQYQIHPQTDYFYIWHKDGDGMPAGLEALPIEPYGGDYTLADSGLYKVREDANLQNYLKTPAPKP